MSRRSSARAARLAKAASLGGATQHDLRTFWTSCRLCRHAQSYLEFRARALRNPSLRVQFDGLPVRAPARGGRGSCGARGRPGKIRRRLLRSCRCGQSPVLLRLSRGSSEQVCIGVMMSRRFAGRVAWRSLGWPPWQAARRGLRTFWTSPRHYKIKSPICLRAAHRCASSTDTQSAFAVAP